MNTVITELTFKLKPQKGQIVFDPITHIPLKAEGEIKPKIEYWFRQLMEKTVVRVAE